MGIRPSKAKLEQVAIETAAKIKPVEIEWTARKEIALAQVKLDGKKADLDYKFKMEKLTNDKIKNTLHVPTQSEIIVKIVERGFSPDDFCMAAGISYLTLKEELQNKEMEILKKTMMKSMEHKTKANRNRHTDELDTGSESDIATENSQIVSTTVA